MEIMTVVLIAVILLIIVGLLLNRISWDRAIVLLLVTAVIAAAVAFLLGYLA